MIPELQRPVDRGELPLLTNMRYLARAHPDSAMHDLLTLDASYFPVDNPSRVFTLRAGIGITVACETGRIEDFCTVRDLICDHQLTDQTHLQLGRIAESTATLDPEFAKETARMITNSDARKAKTLREIALDTNDEVCALEALAILLDAEDAQEPTGKDRLRAFESKVRRQFPDVAERAEEGRTLGRFDMLRFEEGLEQVDLAQLSWILKRVAEWPESTEGQRLRKENALNRIADTLTDRSQPGSD